MSCAVLGPRGTFSEEAAHRYWGEAMNITTAQSIPELFQMLLRGEIDDVLVPIENSLAGSIDISMACLQEYPVCIKGEIVMPIEQHLVAAEYYPLEEIELLVSQPTALMQCTHYVNTALPGVRTEISPSTSRAMEIIKGESRKAAAIGSVQAAQIYGLKIIRSNIANRYNSTRFVHVGQGNSLLPVGDKASLIFTLPDNPGSLYHALGIFASRNLNLSKIESRPGKTGRDSYSFYIEVDVPGDKQAMENALQELQDYCLTVKYLGLYNCRTEDTAC